jgi:hypothetical protein
VSTARQPPAQTARSPVPLLPAALGSPRLVRVGVAAQVAGLPLKLSCPPRRQGRVASASGHKPLVPRNSFELGRNSFSCGAHYPLNDANKMTDWPKPADCVLTMRLHPTEAELQLVDKAGLPRA